MNDQFLNSLRRGPGPRVRAAVEVAAAGARCAGRRRAALADVALARDRCVGRRARVRVYVPGGAQRGGGVPRLLPRREFRGRRIRSAAHGAAVVERFGRLVDVDRPAGDARGSASAARRVLDARRGRCRRRDALAHADLAAAGVSRSPRSKSAVSVSSVSRATPRSCRPCSTRSRSPTCPYRPRSTVRPSRFKFRRSRGSCTPTVSIRSRSRSRGVRSSRCPRASTSLRLRRSGCGCSVSTAPRPIVSRRASTGGAPCSCRCRPPRRPSIRSRCRAGPGS